MTVCSEVLGSRIILLTRLPKSSDKVLTVVWSIFGGPICAILGVVYKAEKADPRVISHCDDDSSYAPSHH